MQNKKIGLFIDYANLLSSMKKNNKFIDFSKLLTFLENEFGWKMEFKSIYFAYPEINTRDYDVSWIHNFARFLNAQLWFHIKKKPLKQIEIRDSKWKIILNGDWSPSVIEKWNLDIELTMDVMQTWHHFDIMVLFSGDSDFQCLTEFLLWKDKEVYVFSTMWNISSELKTHSTKYYDIKNLPADTFRNNEKSHL